MTCEWCGTQLPPATNGSRGRRFCTDACRKRASRAGPAVPPATADEGPVTASVRDLLAELDHAAHVDAARGQMALALARLVDAGSVPAAHELRGLLSELALVEDEDIAAFHASIQTPRRLPPIEAP